ncbi:pyruvate, phosphate dikinase [Cohaesibacter gelatinilyticus]|uniref:Pyruvate, phosphate dikinase n=1 Tax=Cohaesibacter gelatinilyticus TaxID=372072 RepID=A0A285N9C5_9HYPH|nr:pyruvate, phosphate dikinase [Cohaesibacter gelatinilyticus]SNZ06020.1 pyruvate phosphate dikinase [Cohaesibacter gelatinilyticus]
MAQWVYGFGNGSAQGDASMRSLLGGKGANLAEMSNLGLPVPPGFTLTTELCRYYYDNGHSYPEDLKAQVKDALAKVGEQTGRRFGDAEHPLLLSVRSGARVSMPGMMDTVLNLGLNDVTVEALAQASGDARFAYDSYRRFIQMYGDVVMGVDHHDFEDIIEQIKDERGYVLDTDLSADDWKNVIARYKLLIEDELEEAFPQDGEEQLWGAIGAVFSSWMNARAITYRRLHDIPEDWGTGVNIQAMVFGNMGQDSATGVAFTRNPSTGEKALYGEFLINAQGEDVVAGIRTPQDLTLQARLSGHNQAPSMEEVMPKAFSEFSDICQTLEHHYKDMQDLEFTIERGRLWMLQTRIGKRTGKAALRIAVEMANEGVISRDEAILRIDPRSLDQLLHPTIAEDAERNLVAKGLPASPGAASGQLIFHADEAESLAAQGRRVILARVETSPEDIHGMHAAQGILTARGGMTSHAAVVARGMGKPCVSGAGSLRIDYDKEILSVGHITLKKGDVVTICGSSGEILLGDVPMQKPELTGEFSTLMGWVDEARRMRVRCNAETPQDAKSAREFGAEGIGLCRTEHMFFDEDRISAMREMIFAEDVEARRDALATLLPMQRKDFTELFEIMAGLPVTIRLLDPPLHEFVPHEVEDIAHVAPSLRLTPEALQARITTLHEFNPMLGHRGCRLAITYPEIAEMQVRAIFEAAITAAVKTGRAVQPEIMVPLVGLREELDYVKARIDAVGADVMAEAGRSVDYSVGTMIELPRACLQARTIAESAEFFSFGTNDLTQTTYGISRDDASRFLADYQRLGIIDHDPFISLDTNGVGELIEIAAERGRFARDDIKMGICGEHGGDPASIEFCEKIELDYVSCSPFRVPIARLAAAQAYLKAAEHR